MFGGSGFSLTKAQLQAEESKGKVLEAINFLVRGVRLLGSDAQNSVRLVTKAALGKSPDDSLEDGPCIVLLTPRLQHAFTHACMHSHPQTHSSELFCGLHHCFNNRIRTPSK